MLKKQLFQESIEEYFRKQSLDTSQRETLKTCLQNSRYSRLSYTNNTGDRIDECLLLDTSPKTIPNDDSSSNRVTSEQSNKREDDLIRAFEVLETSKIRGLEKLTKDND